MKKKNLVLILIISAVILLTRLIPHAPNFSPLAALILFAGAYLSKTKYLIWLFLAILVSDFFLGFYEPLIMLAVYFSLAINLILGNIIKKHKSFLNIISVSLLSSLLFFLITNFAVWAAGDWYPHNLNGLLLSYDLALPFFKNTLVSSLLYTGLFFGVYESILCWQKRKTLFLTKEN